LPKGSEKKDIPESSEGFGRGHGFFGDMSMECIILYWWNCNWGMLQGTEIG